MGAAVKMDALVEQLADELRRYCDKIDLTDPFDKTTRECWELVERATRSGVNAELVWGVVRHYAEAYHQDKGDHQASSAAAIVRQLVEAGMMLADTFTTPIHSICNCPRCAAGRNKFAAALKEARAWLEEEAR